jgi:hypothetical protein
LLHLLDFALALVIEVVNTTSELFLVKSFLENYFAKKKAYHVLKLQDLILGDQEAATLVVEELLH